MPRSFYLFQATGKFTDLGRPTSAVLHQVGFCTLPGFSCLVTICLVDVQETAWWLSPTLMVNILLMVNIWLTIVNNMFWLVVEAPTPLKNDGVSESQPRDMLGWFFSIPNCFWKVTKFHGSRHQQPLWNMWKTQRVLPQFDLESPASKNTSQKHQKEADKLCLVWSMGIPGS